MAAYCTQQDLIDRFGQAELLEIADRDSDTVIDAAVVTGAIADAGDEIDGFVGRRYDLPLASTPSLLKVLACDIARYRLYKDQPTERVKDAYKEAIARLKQIGDGQVLLDIAGAEPSPIADTPLVQSQDRVFSRETLKGW